MLKHLLTFCFLGLLAGHQVLGQQTKQRVFTSDIDRFWVAYDSMRTTTDSLRQLSYLNRIYIEPGTPGLRALMEAKDYTPGEWVSAVRRYPRFWNSIRPRTLLAKSGVEGLEDYLLKFKALYPALRPATIYFTIGALRSGGTTQDSLVLIGAEVSTGTPAVDISEFSKATQIFLANNYRTDPIKHIIPLNVHEYVHTQIRHYGQNVLGQAIYEGICDLITQLVTGKTMPYAYTSYGPQHEAALKERFKTEMFVPSFRNWFYNNSSEDPNHIGDLGYYMGYAICKAYYQRATNKQQAIREMIELDYTSNLAVEAFLTKSRYFSGSSVAALRVAYERKRPYVTQIRPLVSSQAVDASLKELIIEFSQPMSPYTSIDYGAGGKTTWPNLKKVGFATDKRSITFKVDLLPEHDYEFVVTDGGFQSEDGYPLKPYSVRFRTGK
ncbi:DUF2268 domain-containing putative Zn-dependent protease [Hymenobacter glacieicola]|uniref:DUF2268 domain-containing protein n=1 Tax=Hymenobacter glacieicola TaxID=1562124 RepID=A0ABQ1WRQ3_9BACT|nr:DUF2268 domain-containing putative Zn-dependent protease [Hymenobacter glacieicola]GGG43422.1 hypothetical protein GCM10011378_19750 [Hymenobacter glacieicola]